MSADIVSEAIDKVAKEKGKYKPVTVEKLLELEYDLGTLLAIDTNEINSKELSSNKDKYLLNLARDNTQLLLNKLWELPCEKVEEAIVAKLPKQTYSLPREKPVPKPKPLTKWEVYAKEKGLQKTKKAKVTWDDILKKWVPTYGYRRAAAEKDKDWVLEVPENADPYEDQFEKKRVTRKEKVAKNEFQRLRNIASANNIKVPYMGLPPTEKLSSTQLVTAESLATMSTASLGKFQPRLRKVKALSKENTLPGSQKRKITVLPSAEEKSANIDIVDTVLNKKPKLDVTKAVNKHLYQEQLQRSAEKGQMKRKGGKGRGRAKGRGNRKKIDLKKLPGITRGSGGKRPAPGGKRPAPGKGKRNPHTKTKGRKRR